MLRVVFVSPFWTVIMPRACRVECDAPTSASLAASNIKLAGKILCAGFGYRHCRRDHHPAALSATPNQPWWWWQSYPTTTIFLSFYLSPARGHIKYYVESQEFVTHTVLTIFLFKIFFSQASTSLAGSYFFFFFTSRGNNNIKLLTHKKKCMNK